MMLFLLIVAVAFVAAEPEADPLYLYNGIHGTRHLGYNMYNPIVSPYTNYWGRRQFYKREAEAEPEAEADPLYLYNGIHGARNFGYNMYNPIVSPYTNYWGRRTFYKREAEAEPEAEAEADPLYLYNGIHGARNFGYNMYNPIVSPYTNYWGRRHFYKREAEAEPEADPNLVYTDGRGFHTNLENLHKGIHRPYTYGSVGSVYNTVPVYRGLHYVYKREAEAESDPLYYNTHLYNRAWPYTSSFYNHHVNPYRAYPGIYNY